LAGYILRAGETRSQGGMVGCPLASQNDMPGSGSV